jgi:hypothetical protein
LGVGYRFTAKERKWAERERALSPEHIQNILIDGFHHLD